jgi:GMP reductase
MKILDDIKLDFTDVLLIPKRNEYTSRSEAILERTIKFKYSPYEWNGVPIMVSNMDSTGTIEMAKALQKHKIITCLHKYYKSSDIPPDLDKNYYAVSSGSLSQAPSACSKSSGSASGTSPTGSR